MNNFSYELDSARAILKTYHQVYDTPDNQKRILKTKSQSPQKNKDLEEELTFLQEKYSVLQNELSKRDEKIIKLNRQLVDRSNDMQRLQEDFENAIYQLTK